MESKSDGDVAAVERAMVAIRRSQNRRTLGRLAAANQGVRPGRAAAAAPSATPANSAADNASRTSAEVLDVIEEAEEAGRPATVSSVATALNIDQPRASKLVAAAVAARLVRREADQADGRRALLVRTAAGRQLSARAHAFRQQIFGEAMAGWPDADRAEFARLLTVFVASLGAVVSKPVARR